jgi:hypothetical protein
VKNEIMHLTEADLAPAAAAHLAACETCTARLREAQAPIAAFGSLSLAWSERRSATLPAQPAFARVAWRLPASAAAVCAAAMAIIVALPALHHRADAAAPGSQASIQQPVQTAGIAVPTMTSMTSASAAYKTSPAAASLSTDDAQISRDNTMLRTIDQELEASAETPAALDHEMGLQPGSDAVVRQTGSLLN